MAYEKPDLLVGDHSKTFGKSGPGAGVVLATGGETGRMFVFESTMVPIAYTRSGPGSPRLFSVGRLGA